jgi:putative Mg2+ transporter-C (MgtC) family protein
MESLINEVMTKLHFDLALFISLLIKIVIAAVLTSPVSVERYKDDRSAGLRTFPIVAVASCGYVILAGQVFGISSGQQAPIMQGLVTGIGFIGGGAIVKDGNRVRGTATAAAIWSTSIVGAAVGYGRLEIALVVGLFTTLTLTISSRFEMKWQLERDARDAAAGVVQSAQTALSDVGLRPSSRPGTPSSGL